MRGPISRSGAIAKRSDMTALWQGEKHRADPPVNNLTSVVTTSKARAPPARVRGGPGRGGPRGEAPAPGRYPSRPASAKVAMPPRTAAADLTIGTASRSEEHTSEL